MKRTSWLIYLSFENHFSQGGMNILRNIFKINHKNLVNKGTAQVVPIKTEVLGKNLRWEEYLQDYVRDAWPHLFCQ